MGYNAVKTGTHFSCRPVRRWRHRPKCVISQDIAVGKSDVLCSVRTSVRQQLASVKWTVCYYL